MAFQSYQALLSSQQSIARVRQSRRDIERVGGSVIIEPPTPSGMVIVTLTLPDPHHPRDFFPDLPFYPA